MSSWSPLDSFCKLASFLSHELTDLQMCKRALAEGIHNKTLDSTFS